MDDKSDISLLLPCIRGGDEQALGRLLPVLYQELRRVAANLMRRQPPGHTLQPTAVVHEAYLRMIGGANIDLADRAHFFAVAARTMRQVLVDHARHKLALKRGGDMRHSPEADIALAFTTPRPEEMLALDEALARLQTLDARQARIVEMHYFAGNPIDEIAAAFDIGERTVKRELQTARLFLKQQLAGKSMEL